MIHHVPYRRVIRVRRGSKCSQPATGVRDIVRWVLVCIGVCGIACLTVEAGGAEVALQDSGMVAGHGGGPGFEKEGELVFMSPQGAIRSKIDIEIADTPADREIGLMVRTELADTHGMLFLFRLEKFRAFWMKNTAIPLDIIFVSAQMRIVTIHQSTVPFAETSYASTEPAQYVVEVNAGFAREHDIQVGDRVFWQRM
jgi:uncharacterized membrane protein (UPF0127 family)